MTDQNTGAADSPHGSSLTHLHQRRYWILLSAFAVLAWIIAGITTSKYGAGVASDSVKYLAVAQSLLDGKGLVTHIGVPLLSWPPLYSITLAGISLLTGWTVFTSGWYLNVFLNGINIILGGVILIRVFRAKPLYAVLSNVFIVTAISSLRLHATISSDPLYLTFTLGFLLAAHTYVTKRSISAFVWMVIFSALAPMQRYVGLALATTAVIVFFIEHRRNFRLFLRDSLILGVATILPIGWWLILRNLMTYGTLFGTNNPPSDILQNFMLGLTKMLHWYVPYYSAIMPILERPWIPLGLILLVLVIINKRGNWANWFSMAGDKSAYPTLVHGIVYFTAVGLTIVTRDHLDLTSDRYYAILLVPAALLMFITWDALILPHVKLKARQAAYAVVILFVVWSAYPVLALAKYLNNALQMGEPSNYNYYNSSYFRDTEVVDAMIELAKEHPNATFYSNYVDAAWFFTGNEVGLMPLVENTDTGWPPAPGYIVWFDPNEYLHYLPPEDIASFANLTLLHQSDSGRIYSVRPR